MRAVHASEAGTRTRGETAAEWAGIVTAPLAWTLHLWFNYGLEEFVTCGRAAPSRRQLLGLDVRVWVALSNTALAALALGAALFSLARYRRLRGSDRSPGGRAEWMALCGVMVSVLFFIIIVMGIAPAVVLRPCRLSP